jgi:hypothetical protein
MAECKSLSTCPFFNDKMADMPSVAIVLKKRYCLGNNALCARFMVSSAIGKEKVPLDLFPEEVDRAEELIGRTT